MSLTEVPVDVKDAFTSLTDVPVDVNHAPIPMTDARVSDIHAPKALTDLPIVTKSARERGFSPRFGVVPDIP